MRRHQNDFGFGAIERTRLARAYPSTAKYRGSGDIDRAEMVHTFASAKIKRCYILIQKGRATKRNLQGTIWHI